MARSWGARAATAAGTLAAAGALSLRSGESDTDLPLRLEKGHVPLFVKWEDYLGNDLSNVNFVQIGGNCGTNLPECAVGGDPVWEYATRFGWNGIVLEPVPHIFDKLTENYKDYPKVRPVQALVSNHSGHGKILDRAETSHEISASRKRAGVSVPTYTLRALWNKVFGANESKIDLLVVDAEGNEAKILSGKFPQPKPQLVLFEIANLQPVDLNAIHDNLIKEGYVLRAKLRHQDDLGSQMPPQDALYELRNELSVPLILPKGHVPLFVKWEEYLQSMKDVNFVQIGGNCGTNIKNCTAGGDPIWEYATRFGWNGTVLEPVPHIFEELSSNYKPYPSVKPVQALVSDHSGTGKILDRARASHEISGASKQGIEVPTYTLASLWNEVIGKDKVKVDILVVDAEGNEPRILSGGFPSPKPRLVLFKTANLKPADAEKVDANLRNEGYILLKHLTHMDKIGKFMPPQDALYGLLATAQ